MSVSIRHELVSSEERGLNPRWFVARCSCGEGFGNSKQDRAEARAVKHAAEANRKACPNPAKAAYRTRADAERDLPRRWAEHSWGTSNLRAYQCQCGRWHFTSQPKAGDS